MHARTVEHKRPFAPGCASSAVAAHARDPDGLAAGLTILLDGGLASGVLDGDLRTADAAHAAARALVGADCPA
jgi:hypothetical protein